MKLPIPENRASWLAALACISISFLLYYQFAYPQLQSYYGTHLFANYKIDLCPVTQDSKVIVTAQIPRQVSSFAQRWIYLNIYNNHNAPIDIEIWVSLTKMQGNTPERTLLLPYMFTEDRFVREITFSQLQSRAIGVGRIPLLAFDEPGNISVRFWTNLPSCNTKPNLTAPYEMIFPNASSIIVDYDALGTFLSSFIEVLLLPPLANGLIPALVLFLIWIIDPLTDEQVNKGKLSVSAQFLVDFIDGMLPISALVLCLMVLLWNWQILIWIFLLSLILLYIYFFVFNNYSSPDDGMISELSFNLAQNLEKSRLVKILRGNKGKIDLGSYLPRDRRKSWLEILLKLIWLPFYKAKKKTEDFS